AQRTGRLAFHVEQRLGKLDVVQPGGGNGLRLAGGPASHKGQQTSPGRTERRSESFSVRSEDKIAARRQPQLPRHGVGDFKTGYKNIDQRQASAGLHIYRRHNKLVQMILNDVKAALLRRELAARVVHEIQAAGRRDSLVSGEPRNYAPLWIGHHHQAALAELTLEIAEQIAGSVGNRRGVPGAEGRPHLRRTGDL